MAAVVLLAGLLGYVLRAGGDMARVRAARAASVQPRGAARPTPGAERRAPETRGVRRTAGQREARQQAPLQQAPPSGVQPLPELTYGEVLRRYSMPDDPRTWADTVAAWLDEEDVVGPAETSFKLFNALERCSGAPRDAADLERRAGLYRLQESYGLRAAGHARENVERTTSEFEACSRIAEMVSETPEDLLATAAELGLAPAQVRLATEWVPAGFETWAAERRRRHREDMGGLLLEALHRCEPSALLAVSTGANRGHLWELPAGSSPVDPSVEQYAYRLALGLYQAQRTRAPSETGVLEDNAAALRSHVWAHLMTREDVRRAEELGREVFAASCAGSSPFPNLN